MHLYMGADIDRIDIPGSVYGDLVNYWYSMPFITGGRSKSELRTIAEMLLPVYVYGRLYEGIPAPELVFGGWLASANRELVTYVESRSGITGEPVRDFLMLMFDAVQAGIVPAWILEPATWEEVRPATITEKLTPAAASMFDWYGGQFTKVLIVGGAVAAVVGLGYVITKNR